MGNPCCLAACLIFLFMGVFFHSLQDSGLLPALRRIKRHLVRLFRHKYSFGIIIALWTAGVAMGMAAYSPPIPIEFFEISYALLVAAIIWSIGAFLTPRFLRNVKAETRERSEFYYLWVAIVPVLILCLGAYLIIKVHSIENGREFLAMNGVLYPADDPDPPTDTNCGKASSEDGALTLYLGSSIAITHGKHLTVIGLEPALPGEDYYDPVLLGIDRNPDNSIALHANVMGKDNRLIAQIDRNMFKIARNRLLDPLSPPRSDKSTIVLTDEDGNAFRARYLNKHSISFSGRLYFRAREYIVLDDDGVSIIPGGRKWMSSMCFDFTNTQSDGGLILVPRKIK